MAIAVPTTLAGVARPVEPMKIPDKIIDRVMAIISGRIYTPDIIGLALWILWK